MDLNIQVKIFNYVKYRHKMCLKRLPVIEVVSFTTEPSVFQNRLLNGAHSILDHT